MNLSLKSILSSLLINGIFILGLTSLCTCSCNCSCNPTQNDSISAKTAIKVQKEITENWFINTKIATREEWENNLITAGPNTLRIWKKTYGAKPKDGRSLWISLHGGGGLTTEENNQQWNNQQKLYTPKEGVYIAPRSPIDAWNMWFVEEINPLLMELIKVAIVQEDVNPNKVYIVGYSAGGDGVWRLAPRLADYWAAASMMAGHPGEISMVNLMNTPFMIWCGANDSAYDRNRLDKEHGEVLDSLEKANPGSYIHETHILEGKGHWMDNIDKAALPWMSKFVRNPYPQKIVFRQEEVLRDVFYYVGIPQEEAKHGKTVVIQHDGNLFEIVECDYSKVILYLNDSIANLDKEIKVRFNDKEIFCGKLKRSKETMISTIEQRNDPNYCFSSKIEITL